MPHTYAVIKKVVRQAANQVSDVGTDDQSIAGVASGTQSDQLGDVNHQFDNLTADLDVPIGLDSQSLMLTNDQGTANVPTGEDDQALSANSVGQMGALDFGTDAQSCSDNLISATTLGTGSDSASLAIAINTGSGTDNLGTAAESLQVDSAVEAKGLGGSASSSSWTNPNDSLSDSDGGATSQSLQNQGAVPSGYTQTLTVSSFSTDADPGNGDWSLDKVEVQVRHHWDLTVGVGNSVNYEIFIEQSGGESPLNIPAFDRDQTDGTQATLTTEIADVTSHVSGWTNAQLEGARLRFVHSSTLGHALNNSSVNVDWVKLIFTFSRNNFS